MASGEQRFLGDLLVKRGVVAPDRMESFYAVQREKGVDLTDLLVGAQICDDAVVGRVLAEEAQLPYTEGVDPERITTALATRLPITFAKQRKIIVVSEDDAQVNVICADPFDTAALDDVRLLFGKPVEASVGPREKILDAI